MNTNKNKNTNQINQNINTKKNQKSLEQLLSSYNVLIICLIVFIILMIVLYILNPKGFNIFFSYEIFITIPILLLLVYLIKETILLKKNPEQSVFKFFSQYQKTWFFLSLIFIIGLLGLSLLLVVLYLGGIFSNNPPENNIEMLINFGIIIFVVMIMFVIYNNSKSKDEVLLKKIPPAIQDIYNMRTKYTMMFALFLLSMTMLYFLNPFGIMTNYIGPVIFFTLLIGIIFVLVIKIYQYMFDNNISNKEIKPSFVSILFKSVYILGSIALFTVLIYLLLKYIGIFTNNNWGHVILNVILVIIMLVIIYKLLNTTGMLTKTNNLLLKNKYYNSLKNNNIQPLFSNATSFEIKMLVLSIILLIGYYLWTHVIKKYIITRYLTQGGRQLINQPIPTNVSSNLIINDTNTNNYNYAISFWFYLDSFPPSTNASYSKIVPIFSYENVIIKYCSQTNTLFFSTKENGKDGNGEDKNKNGKNKNGKEVNGEENKDGNENGKNKNGKDGNGEKVNTMNTIKNNIYKAIQQVKNMSNVYETDNSGNRILYKEKNVLLQKWNQIVLNYNGGTLDVFYNGKLVQSAIEIVPYMKYDMMTIGTENGISGNIANLIYFNYSLDILTINTLYNHLKDKNPPSIAENDKGLIT
jgi:hypothetical protein